MLCSSTCAMFWSLGPRGARYLMTAFCNKRCRAAMHCVGPVHATLEQYMRVHKQLRNANALRGTRAVAETRILAGSKDAV